MKLFVEIENCYEICTKYKQPGLNPIVDLKEISGTKFLQIIDNATRFSTAAVVRSKRMEEIVDTFIKHWIAIFGAPGLVLLDNGGDFNNSWFLNMAERLNTTLKTTATESPWSNGMVEINNCNKYSFDIVIRWAVNAKNSLHNCYGYGPNQ